MVQEPAFGDGALADVVAADFALGGHAGPEVDDDRGVGGSGWYRSAEGVGAQPRLETPGRGDPLRGTAVVDRRQQQELLFSSPLSVFAQPADVPAVPRRPGCNTQDPRLGND